MNRNGHSRDVQPLGAHACPCGREVTIVRAVYTSRHNGRSSSVAVHEYYIGSRLRSVCDCQRRLTPALFGLAGREAV